MKGSDIKVGNLVQVHVGYGRPTADDLPIIGEVVATGLQQAARYEPRRSAKFTLPDGRVIEGYRRPSSGNGTHHVVRIVKRLQRDDTWLTSPDDSARQGQIGSLEFARSADVLRTWTPEVEVEVLAERKARQEAATAKRQDTMVRLQRIAGARNEAAEELRDLVPDADLLPKWVHEPVGITNTYRDELQGGVGTLTVTVLAEIVRAAYREGHADASAGHKSRVTS